MDTRNTPKTPVPSAPELPIDIEQKKPDDKNELSMTWQQSLFKSDKPKEITTEPVPYLEPDFPSFNHLKPSQFIYAPDTQNNFIEWSKEQNLDWIRKPNANSNFELLQQINGQTPKFNPMRPVLNIILGILTLGIYHFFKTRMLKPGEIHFSDNAGQQQIHMGNNFSTLSNPFHNWEADHKINERYINEKNITIVQIQPGEVGIAKDNGKPVVLLPGRHAYNSPTFELKRSNIQNIKNNPNLQMDSLSITRILPGELGLAFDNKVPILLMPGLHIKNNNSFEFKDTLNTRTLRTKKMSAQDHKHNEPNVSFEHGDTISIVSLAQNQIGCVKQGSDAFFLKPGLHIKNDKTFEFKIAKDLNQKYIGFYNLHLLRVAGDEFAKVVNDNQAYLLNSGYHAINSPSFKFDEKNGICKTSDELIEHGSITRFIVKDGELGYAWNQGKIMEIEPGAYYKDNQLFKFDESLPVNIPIIHKGNITHILVKEGEAHAMWENGKLNVLNSGRYSFKSPTIQYAAEPISLQEFISPLHEIKCSTQDRVQMHVTGQISFQIIDAKQFIKNQGTQKNLIDSLKMKTEGVLRQQMSMADISKISPEHHHHGIQEAKPSTNLKVNQANATKLNEGEEKNYRGKLCNQVKSELDQLTREWGIAIRDFGISDIGFQDPKVQAALEKATIDARQQESALDIQQAKNLVTIAATEAETKQKLLLEENLNRINELKSIRENNQIKQLAQTKIEIKNAEIAAERNLAEQQAEMGLVKAKAANDIKKADIAAQHNLAQQQAEMLVMNAKAEKEAACLKAEGDAKIIEVSLNQYNNSNYMALKMMEQFAVASKSFANNSSPAIVVAGNDQVARSMFSGGEISVLFQSIIKEQASKLGLFKPQAAPPIQLQDRQPMRTNVECKS